MTEKLLPPACRFTDSDPPGKQLFAIYNQGGDPETRGLAWNGSPVPTWENVTDQVREKWTNLASVLDFKSKQADDDKRIAKALNPLPELHHGHAWLLKFLFKEFSADPFTFDLERVKFEGNGKGVNVEREQENTKRWFSELVEHAAIVLREKPSNGLPPTWCVRSLANVTDDVVTLDPGMTLQRLLREFIDIIPEEKVVKAACVVIKGDGIPPGFENELYRKIVAAGAKTDVLVIGLPPGVELSMLSVERMKTKGWVPAVTKSRLWTPNNPIPRG